MLNDLTKGSGSAFTGFNALLYNKIVDLDFFRQLVMQQEMTMLRDQHLQIIWLVRGRFPVALWPSTGRMAEYKEAGAPIEWLVTREGGASGWGWCRFGPDEQGAPLYYPPSCQALWGCFLNIH